MDGCFDLKADGVKGVVCNGQSETISGQTLVFRKHRQESPLFQVWDQRLGDFSLWQGCVCVERQTLIKHSSSTHQVLTTVLEHDCGLGHDVWLQVRTFPLEQEQSNLCGWVCWGEVVETR